MFRTFELLLFDLICHISLSLSLTHSLRLKLDKKIQVKVIKY